MPFLVVGVSLLVACGADEIVLEADGLGVVSFGDRVDAALPKLTGILGSPSVDQTLAPPWPEPGSSWKSTPDLACTQATGYKCLNYLRRVVWDRWGLAVVFSDVRGYSMSLQPIPDDPHLVVWEQWSPAAGNAFSLRSGVAPGSTVGDLRETYGTDLGDTVIGCPGADLYVTELRLPNGSVHVLPGNDTTRSEPLDAATKKTDSARNITFMWAGFHKDCRPGLPFQGADLSEIDILAAGAPACGWLDQAQIDLALHEMGIVVSDDEAARPPESWIVARLVEECADIGGDAIQSACVEYHLATDPDEIAYRHEIYGAFYAEKQTRFHSQNATWTVTWILAANAENSDSASVEEFLANACPIG